MRSSLAMIHMQHSPELQGTQYGLLLLHCSWVIGDIFNSCPWCSKSCNVEVDVVVRMQMV